MSHPDAVVVGSGPNGLMAAIVIAATGRKVVVFEANEQMGGGVRSAELTLPGFVHDLCSAVHPLAVLSPAFRTLPLAAHGLDWIEPPRMSAHPFDDGTAATVSRSVDVTAAALGRDANAYRALVGSVVTAWPRIESSVLGPLGWPAHPAALARFGFHAFQSAQGAARRTFAEAPARALFAGIAAHGMLPLDQPLTAGVALVLGAAAHVGGWAFPRGGAQRLTDALVAHLRSLGGDVMTGTRIRALDELPAARATLCDLSPKPFLAIAGSKLPGRYRRALESYRYGMGAFKVDWALAAPIPWTAPGCAEAGTVHLGGTLEEIASSERQVWEGAVTDRPYVLLTQPSLFDPTRAPVGQHTVWAYCHVPNGSRLDMLDRIERQIERFAPGFRARVLARAVTPPADLEARNANLVGGDIGAGVMDLRQTFTRPTRHTYSTPIRGVYLCSAATPPGVGVHGMCGYFAAQRALTEVLRD